MGIDGRCGPAFRLMVVALAIAPLRADAAGGALPDPCYDPDRPWPVYCERLEQGTLGQGDASARYQLYGFYEDLAGDQRPPQWVFDYELPYRASAIRLYDAAGQPLLRLEYDVGLAWIARPEIIDGAAGRLLVVRVGYTGSGANWDYYLFGRAGDRWTAIAASPWRDGATPGWGDDIAERLPPDLAVWKGIVIDFATMTATSGLWRPDDANCCPTGGEADLGFAIRDGRLRVVDVVVRPPQ